MSKIAGDTGSPQGVRGGGRGRNRRLQEFAQHCWILQKIAGVAKGSGTPNTVKVGKVNREQLEEVAKQKMPDLTAADMDAAVRTIAGSARSMGLDVEGL